jgi:hypothetical protein
VARGAILQVAVARTFIPALMLFNVFPFPVFWQCNIFTALVVWQGKKEKLYSTSRQLAR